ncbi:ABC transporter permease [Actinocorallia longicatena]|uniref:FtsX-like permease family protein n=1 Tax=Actinocorallia longicatena TaxID=111803 RepID=A0ABP6QM40_9ACTN
MLFLVVASLRERKAAFAGAFLALFCAAALVSAGGTLLQTGLRGSIAPERYAGTPVVVSGDQNVHATKKKGKRKAKPIAERAWIPADLAGRIRALPGVAKAVPEVTFPVTVGGAPGWGHGWGSAELTPFTLASGRPPRGGHEAVVDAAHAGAEVRAGGRTYEVVGVTTRNARHQATVFFADEEAHRLAGRPGLVSAIGVWPRIDVSAALAGTTALASAGDARGRVEFPAAERSRVKLISLGGAICGTSLLVAVLVVSGTIALSLQQRQRELALLRAVAATPRQLRRMIGREALAVGVCAASLGAAAGPLPAAWMRTRFVALGAVPENLHLVSGPFPVLAAIGATVVAGWASARLSARRIARIRPVEALGEAGLAQRTGPGRVVVGVLVLAGSVVLTIVLSGLSTEAAASPVVVLTALLWTIAVALLGPPLTRAALAVLTLPLRASRAGGFLAAANLRFASARMASVVTPLCLLVALTSTILFSRTTMERATTAERDAGTVAAHTVGPRVPAEAARALREVPGVTEVTEVVRTTVRIGLDKRSAQGVTAGAGTLDLGVTAGDLGALSPGTVAVGEGLGRRVGDTLSLTLGDGTPVRVKVVAVYARTLAFGDLTFDHALLAAHVDDPRGTVLIAGTASPAALTAALRPYGLRLGSGPGERAAGPDAEAGLVAMGLVIGFALIAAVNTLAMATSERSREFALLRLAGATRRQILGMLTLETALVALLATAAGTAIALVTLTAYAHGMTGGPPRPSTGVHLGLVAATAAVAVAATLLPARLALRRPAL